MNLLRAVLCGAFALCSVISASADDTNRASQILTAELAQKILGVPVQSSLTKIPDTEMGQTWVSRVSYQSKTGGASAPGVSLLIRHAASVAEAKPIFESSKATFHGEDVSGLGDAAYRTKTPAQLDVLKGANWLIISAGTFQSPDTAAQEKAAREILAKIPNS
jgi:hypothetical protein